jgi:S1-C subfamily serine protease
MLRQIMADGKEISNQVVAIGSPLLLTGGTMTGPIVRSGRGGHYHANSVGSGDPQIYTLVDGSPAPTSPPTGSLVIYYAP